MSLPVDFALGYARRGWVVMPLARGDNRPHSEILGTGWTFDEIGSTDPEVIRTWWDEDPAANIGVVCGARSRILVLDVDVKKTDGETSLEEFGVWQIDPPRPPLPQTASVRTPSGGRHLWFILPEGHDLRRKIGWLPGVDACGAGGFVAVPPSCRIVRPSSGKPWEQLEPEIREYRWLERPGGGYEIAEAPIWLLEDVRTRTPTVLTREGSRVEVDGRLPATEEFVERGFGFFTSSRNMDCYRLAWRLWQEGRSEREVVAVLHLVWSKTSQHPHPFGWGEVYQTLRSAEREWRRTRDAERAEAVATLRAWAGET